MYPFFTFLMVNAKVNYFKANWLEVAEIWCII